VEDARHELIRKVYESWGRGDLSNVEIFDPDVEIVWADGMLDTSVDRGLEEFGKTIQRYLEVVTDFRIEADEIHATPNGAVVLAQVTGMGKESGVPLRTPVTHIWELEDGRAIRVTGHFGHRRDLVAADDG
jgi:ketosteroid isomerase-like protein